MNETPKNQGQGWDSGQYLKFAGPRLRPALDLLARIDVDNPETICDLGCGPGNVTQLLAERWPKADITGIDGSPDMLARAAADFPDMTWVEADLNTWQPDGPIDVVFSNAALHWLDNHAALFPRLMGYLNPGGVLAVQMPGNHAQPSHTSIRAAAGPLLNKIEPHMRPDPVEALGVYYDALEPVSSEVDVWETVYHQILEGDNAVAEWTKGSVLKPLLDALDEDDKETFFRAYSELVGKAYPKRPDGKTIFPFRRVFVVAKR